VQALFLLVGIIVANVLLVGTLLINAQARSSYAQGEQYLSGVPVGQIQHRDRNQNIAESDYISLRRQGFDMLVPLLRQFVLSPLRTISEPQPATGVRQHKYHAVCLSPVSTVGGFSEA
jgi:hypothetical protein